MAESGRLPDRITVFKMNASSKYRAGQWVRVREAEDILRTLDPDGCLDGLPFMPEMLQFCGREFQVFKRAHKTCDTVHKTGGRRLSNAVHLTELRCDGAAHGGCQAGCLLFWKDAWLEPVAGGGGAASAAGAGVTNGSGGPGMSLERLAACTQDRHLTTEAEPVYRCQATQLPQATQLLPWWDVRQYLEDYTSGNIGMGRLLRGAIFMGYYHLINAGIGLGSCLRWLYDRFQSITGGTPYPRRPGRIPPGQRTPTAVLDLQPGELVRVKSHEEILQTLDHNCKNRGLLFDAEEVPFCGGTYRVRSRVERIINEQTGKMHPLKGSAVILEGVYCQACYSSKRLFCPRAIYPYWREIWLERVGSAPAAPLERPAGG
jgi:hypothetical protein